jgi:hypothetical protein
MECSFNEFTGQPETRIGSRRSGEEVHAFTVISAQAKLKHGSVSSHQGTKFLPMARMLRNATSVFSGAPSLHKLPPVFLRGHGVESGKKADDPEE